MKKINENNATPVVETFEKLHEKPVHKMTRRELLGAGLIQFSATIAAPTILGMLSRSGVARADELICSKSTLSNLPPFITINLGGGAGLSGNFVPHDQGLQPLQSYNRLGLGAAGSFPISYEFKNGAPFAAGFSQIIAGIRQTATAGTMAKTVFVAVPNRSQDDSSNNKMSLDGMVIKAGRVGEILATLGANRNEAAFVSPPNPLQVSNFSNIEDAIGVKNSLANLSNSQQDKLFSMIQRLTSHQAAKLIGLSGGSQLSQLIQCAAQDNTRIIASEDPGINPLGNPAFSTLWGLAANNMNTQQFTFGSIVYNVVRGNSPTGNLSLGGYDYHNGTRTSGDAADLRAGQLIGRVLESFALLGQKGFLVVTSDGSVTGPISEQPGGIWTSDRGTAGMMYMMAFDPAGGVNASSFQMGHFLPGKDQQAVDQSFVTGGDPEKAAAGVFANYLNFAGRRDLIDPTIRGVFDTAALTKILKISG